MLMLGFKWSLVLTGRLRSSGWAPPLPECRRMLPWLRPSFRSAPSWRNSEEFHLFSLVSQTELCKSPNEWWCRSPVWGDQLRDYRDRITQGGLAPLVRLPPHCPVNTFPLSLTPTQCTHPLLFNNCPSPCVNAPDTFIAQDAGHSMQTCLIFASLWTLTAQLHPVLHQIQRLNKHRSSHPERQTNKRISISE